MSHQHEHNHHGHIHGEAASCEEGMVKNEKTLGVLLVHWIKHNRSHGKDFEEWIKRAREMDKEETAKFIEMAVEYMEKVNEMLMEAKKNM